MRRLTWLATATVLASARDGRPPPQFGPLSPGEPIAKTPDVTLHESSLSLPLHGANSGGLADAPAASAAPVDPECPSVAACLGNRSCARCLATVNSSLDTHTVNGYLGLSGTGATAYERGFFDGLQHDGLCAAAPLPLLTAALTSLYNSDLCMTRYGLIVSLCAIAEFGCFTDESCRVCLAQLHVGAPGRPPGAEDGWKPKALATPSCQATSPDLVAPMVNNCGTFPRCTLAKVACLAEDGCLPCWAALRRGDGAGAAAACTGQPPPNITDPGRGSSTPLGSSGSPTNGSAAAAAAAAAKASAIALENVVNNCLSESEVGCSFWRARCQSNPLCAGCLSVVTTTDGAGLPGVAGSLASPACMAATADSVALHYLELAVRVCPEVGACTKISIECASKTAAPTAAPTASVCVQCIIDAVGGPGSVGHRRLTPAPSFAPAAHNSSDGNASWTPAATPAVCGAIMRNFGVVETCQPCPATISVVNRVVWATAAVGGISAVLCVGVAVTIVAHGRTAVSMRDRVVVGILLTNAIYSSANAVPISALQTGVTTCGRLALPFATIRFGRAWWFCGKYGLVSFELVILAASIRALTSGNTAVLPGVEALAHVLCWGSAVAAFAIFYVQASAISQRGYNEPTEVEALTDAFAHVGLDDDLDDVTPVTVASAEFSQGRREYDALLRSTLVAWDVLAGVTVFLWVALRLLYRRVLQSLTTGAAELDAIAAADEWASTRQSVWNSRRRELGAMREAFTEVARPLEGYIAVFVLFAAPAFVMSSEWCQDHSGAEARGPHIFSDGNTGYISSGTCDVWCEFALAFRSLGTLGVYLLSRERRLEVFGVRATWSKLVGRARSVVAGGRNSNHYHAIYEDDSDAEADDVPLAEFCSPGELDLEKSQSSTRSGVYRGGDAAAVTAPEVFALPRSLAVNHDFHVDPDTVVKEALLGRGGFAEVWAGTVGGDSRQVAIKFLSTDAIDDEGDPIHPVAAEDFRKECRVLQKLDHPNIVKLLGFGTSASGGGFIVTELLRKGSLERLLLDPTQQVDWRLRVSIGLQVALGMEYLHKQRILHRDLKSAHVLLGDNLDAKVCDFGLARLAMPPQPEVVVSGFTGRARFKSTDSYEDLTSSNSTVAALLTSSTGSAPPSPTISRPPERVFPRRRSWADGESMTRATGTLQYMAPEVFRGDQTYGPKADVYSFGLVLWEIAARAMPWSELGSNLPQLEVFSQLNTALQKGRRPRIPPDVLANRGPFVEVMQRCWAGDPADRPPFSVVVEDLARYLRTVHPAPAPAPAHGAARPVECAPQG